MLEQLLSACDLRFQDERHGQNCRKCTYEGYCPEHNHMCEKCLELVHFPTRVGEGAPSRKYDCTHMADFYVCKYAHKYTSELIYAFRCLRNLSRLTHLNVLSFGCGPCTDLMALDYLRNQGAYTYESLEFRGIDYGADVWCNVHADIRRIAGEDVAVKFFYKDACEIIDEIVDKKWIPHLVTFQYFFSDMSKNKDSSTIIDFVKKFASYVNKKMPENSYIVLNDINLSAEYGGGREYFDRMLTLVDNGLHYKGHFHNSHRPTTFAYGQRFDENGLAFNTTDFAWYNPYGSCSSAQMIIKKGCVE